jgi:hypothetical protein
MQRRDSATHVRQQTSQRIIDTGKCLRMLDHDAARRKRACERPP